MSVFTKFINIMVFMPKIWKYNIRFFIICLSYIYNKSNGNLNYYFYDTFKFNFLRHGYSLDKITISPQKQFRYFIKLKKINK